MEQAVVVNAAVRPAVSPNFVLSIVCVGMVLANLDLFIVNVAIPSIGADFKGASLDDMSWILNGYAITYAALLVFFGRLADRVRRDRSFLLGVALFTGASAACAAANSVEALVAFRVVQAAGAALMTPTSIGLLLAVFPPAQRGGAIRTWTAIGGFGAALGPLMGGLLVTVNWRWIFLVNVPIGLVALLIGWRRLPAIAGHPAPRPRTFDAALITGGIAALILAIIKGNDWGLISSNTILTVAASVVMIAAFVGRCRWLNNPFIDPSLFKIRKFTGATLVMAPFSAAFGAMLLSVALWEQNAWGWSAMKTGLAIAPGPLMVPFTSLLFATSLIKRFGAAKVVSAGILTFVAGLVWFATMIGQEPSFATIVCGMFPIGIGVGLTFPTLMGVSGQSLPQSAYATGSGVINMIRQASMAVGVAIFVAIVGVPSSPFEQLTVFHQVWWIFVLIVLLAMIPTLLLLRENQPVELY